MRVRETSASGPERATWMAKWRQHGRNQSSGWPMILVTGASGTVGREVVRALAQRGEVVRALVRDEERGRPLAELGAELAVGDLEEAAPLVSVFAGIDRVYLLIPSIP